MTYFHKYALCFTIFFVLFVCINQNNTKKKIIKNSSTDVAECHIQHSEDNFKRIDFFGQELQGKYEDILHKLYELPPLSLVERRDTIMLQGNGDKWFSHTVEFCGVPWGMSANFTMTGDNIMSIHDLKFITSKTDDDIIDRVVAELTKYYGEPKWSDDKEDRYDWYEPNDLSITARHLHAPEGGWTFYFYID